jgi:8-oxo-dGTP diphosphatase
MRSTCVYLIRDGKWLMLLRDRKKDDVNEGKWIGVGGKCLEGESFEDCAIREVKEETGLELSELHFSGLVDFRYDTKEPELIAVYTSSSFEGELQECDEGTLAWINEEEILSLELWEGDRIFLEKMLRHETKPFHLTLYYNDQGTLLRFEEEKPNE